MLEVREQTLKWRLEKNIEYGNNYESQAIENYSLYKMQTINLEREIGDTKEKYESKKEYVRNLKLAEQYKYDIENNTKTQESESSHGMLLSVFDNYEMFIVIIIIMIAGTIVSEEFNKGTVKLLLVRPYKRTTILAAKLITSLLMVIIAIAFTIMVQTIVGGVVFGWESMQLPVVQFNMATQEIVTTSIAQYMFILTLGKLPIYILLTVLAFSLSTLFNNSPLAICLPLLGYMASSMINQMALGFKLNWIIYFVTPNWDLTQYMYGGLPMFYGLKIGFSVAICLAYLIIMFAVAFGVFKKKNIKNI